MLCLYDLQDAKLGENREPSIKVPSTNTNYYMRGTKSIFLARGKIHLEVLKIMRPVKSITFE